MGTTIHCEGRAGSSGASEDSGAEEGTTKGCMARYVAMMALSCDPRARAAAPTPASATVAAGRANCTARLLNALGKAGLGGSGNEVSSGAEPDNVSGDGKDGACQRPST